jgi:protein-S-isoprenylcysteine O-methyltransferase Ste14
VTGPPEAKAPNVWRVAVAILALPFAVTVVLPAIILAGAGTSDWGLHGLWRAATVVAGVALIAVGMGLFVATVRLFASIGRGTLAPWDPPDQLVVGGPYRYLRHPMIAGVALVLAGEALALGATGIAIELGLFVAINAVYLPLVEEPALVRRFGADYRRYMEQVPRWLPRLPPWEPEQN